jgi:hypothetical protein
MELKKDKIYKLLRDFFQRISGSGIKIIPDVYGRSVLADDVYNTVTQQEVMASINSNPLLVPNHSLSANEELFDCDDRALQLKASMMALYRQRALASNNRGYPPAIGMVFSMSHVLNIVVCEAANDGFEVFLIDPSQSSPAFINEPEQSAKALGTLPIQFIYI